MSAFFQARLSYLRELIESELGNAMVVPKGYLQEAVTKLGAPFGLTTDEIEKFVKHLETVYGTSQEDGHILKKEFTEWYTQEKSHIDFHYWRRLERYWLKKSILPKDVVRSIDKVTDEIMGFVGNPKDKKSWNRRRGLVMGHVQMGKTTNYSALISKAADSGYRIIIVLAGLTKSLRYQTQVRLDKTFVGKSSVSDATHTKLYDVASVLKGEIEGYTPRFPFCGTTQLSDFNKATAGSVGAHQGNFADPILFVTKKHPRVLEKLTDWLMGLNHGQQLDGPMLLIDDEADNASVNTSLNPQQITAINFGIRKLLSTTKQTTYIGYTATPFANIFIDPESANDMINEDLFPADFIKSLDPPTNYVGSQRLFTDDGDLLEHCVRRIGDDYVNLLPLKHNSKFTVPELPGSLKDAVREYVLFRAIRIASGNETSHTAMLVNVSRFNSVQEQVKEKIDALKSEIAQGIRAWSRAAWQKSNVMLELHRIWVEEFEDSDEVRVTWDELRKYLDKAISSIDTKLVNMKGTGIDYEKAPAAGLHIIGIGGLALARGLTLEGLAVSYVLRNVGAADTLLQMGRWFGYRPGFEKICRIHATQDLVDDFAAVSESVEELRTDFERMALLGKTPYDFGLKVRQSPTGIAITAANKMRSATTISLAEDFSTRHVQAHTLHDSNSRNRENFERILQFRSELSKDYAKNIKHAEVRKALGWERIPGRKILGLIKTLDFPQTEFSGLAAEGSGLLSSYIEDRINTELSEWDVAIPYVTTSKSEAPVNFPFDIGKKAFCRTREGTIRLTKSLVKVNKKNAVAFGTDDFYFGEDENSFLERIRQIKESEKMADPKGREPSDTFAHSKARSRPLLLIHLLQLIPGKEIIDSDNQLKFEPTEPVVSIGVLLPGTKIRCQERRYQASVRLMELLEKLREESQTDEEFMDE